MPTIIKARFGNGQIHFVGKVDPVPATSKTTGIVTVNNAAQPGIEAHYKTSFMLDTQFDVDGISVQNIFHWNSIILNDDENASYRSIEDQAARQIPLMLRAVADELDKEIAAFDAKRRD